MAGRDPAEEIRSRIDTIVDPCSAANGTAMGLAEMGLVDRVEVDDGGHATIYLRLTSPSCMMVGYLAVEITERARRVPGITDARVVTDVGLDWRPSMISPAAQQRRRRALEARGLTTSRSVPQPLA